MFLGNEEAAEEAQLLGSGGCLGSLNTPPSAGRRLRHVGQAVPKASDEAGAVDTLERQDLEARELADEEQDCQQQGHST